MSWKLNPYTWEVIDDKDILKGLTKEDIIALLWATLWWSIQWNINDQTDLINIINNILISVHILPRVDLVNTIQLQRTYSKRTLLTRTHLREHSYKNTL